MSLSPDGIRPQAGWWPLRFGVFMAPFHQAGRNPTLLLEQDLALIEHLDRLGYHEAWIGEHHSGGWEIIASPEVFIAAAAARTRSIRLGTGVVSLALPPSAARRRPHGPARSHHRGRVMLGVGPGQLASDAHMLGIDTNRQREMMEESLEAIVALLDGREPVTRETDWFTLRDARLQLRPFTHPRFEICAAATFSPRAPRLRAASAPVSSRSRPRRSRASTPSATTGASWRRSPPTTAPPSTGKPGGSWVRCTSRRPWTRPGATWPTAWRRSRAT